MQAVEFQQLSPACLDSACWATKRGAALQRLQAELADKGKKLVKGGEKLFAGPSGDQLTYAAREKYARPTDEVADKRLKDVLDKKQLESVSVVAVGPDGTQELRAVLAKRSERGG